MAPTTHQVRQRPPLRALILAAVLMLVGLLLVLMAELLERNILLSVLGLVVLALGGALFGVALWVARAMRVRVVLDDDGFAIEGRTSREAGLWSQVRRVTRGPDRITMYRSDGTRVQLVVPRGRAADLDALGEDIARRLDADRGYGAPDVP